jgi:hypothetical protein
MVVKGQVDALHIGQVGGNVTICDIHLAILHILGVNELYIVDQVQVLEQHGTDKTVEITAGNEAKFFSGHQQQLPELIDRIRKVTQPYGWLKPEPLCRAGKRVLVDL